MGKNNKSNNRDIPGKNQNIPGKNGKIGNYDLRTKDYNSVMLQSSIGCECGIFNQVCVIDGSG